MLDQVSPLFLNLNFLDRLLGGTGATARTMSGVSFKGDLDAILAVQDMRSFTHGGSITPLVRRQAVNCSSQMMGLP
jgi:hypothetical protein